MCALWCQHGWVSPERIRIRSLGERLRCNTIRGNRTESLWEGNLPLRGSLRGPLRGRASEGFRGFSEVFRGFQRFFRGPLRDPLRGRFPSQRLSVPLPLFLLPLKNFSKSQRRRDDTESRAVKRWVFKRGFRIRSSLLFWDFRNFSGIPRLVLFLLPRPTKSTYKVPGTFLKRSATQSGPFPNKAGNPQVWKTPASLLSNGNTIPELEGLGNGPTRGQLSKNSVFLAKVHDNNVFKLSLFYCLKTCCRLARSYKGRRLVQKSSLGRDRAGEIEIWPSNSPAKVLMNMRTKVYTRV